MGSRAQALRLPDLFADVDRGAESRMPTAALRPCKTCGQVGCEAHVRAPWRTQGPPTPRIRGAKLQRLRATLFDRQPLCVHCLAQGRTTRATIRDHVVPLAEGGPDDETNVQPLCQDCSDAKTREESRRGIRRGK